MGPIERALNDSLKDVKLLERDQATAALARSYAQLMDRAETEGDGFDAFTLLRSLGPKYLAALKELGMTPHARGAKGGTASGSASVSALAKQRDELAARRAKHSG